MLEESFGESTCYEQAELLLRVYGELTRPVLPHSHSHNLCNVCLWNLASTITISARIPQR